ncbi:hypothetical protein PF001_g30354 [Phytophthora fragariae]|nr:hypothetical protein PF001_g30354 [Phytophthora fragariae]
MNFLNQHQTQVVGNTPRLKGLLEHLKDHQVTPDVWTTQITVTAIDDYSEQPGPFGTLNEEDADEEKKEDSGSGPTIGSKSAPLDFTQDPSPLSTPQTPQSKQRKHSASSRKFLLRPDPYTPSDNDALDPRKSLARTTEEARASLADHAVIWDEQRTDLQLVMRSGLDYLDAFALVSGDHLVHPRIPVPELTLMLAQMMYWGRLNHPPCAKYVPSWSYKKAESYLDNLDGAPARWPTLKKLRLDDSSGVMEALLSGVGESEDDEDRDVTFKSSVEFKPQAPRTTPPREVKRRRGSVSRTSSSSAPITNDPPSEPPAKLHRPGQDRRRSVLARKSILNWLRMSPHWSKLLDVGLCLGPNTASCSSLDPGRPTRLSRPRDSQTTPRICPRPPSWWWFECGGIHLHSRCCGIGALGRHVPTAPEIPEPALR